MPLIEQISNIESSYRFEKSTKRMLKKDAGGRRQSGGVRQQAMTAAQVLKLKRLSEEACQHQQFQPDLGPADAKRGIVASQY
jgi:hypothetical protein